jgi:hypothetical protein
VGHRDVSDVGSGRKNKILRALGLEQLVMRLLVALAALAAMPVFAQVTTAKPSVYTIDTGAAHYPDHCWYFNEGTGSTVEDECGTGGDWDLTITGADWGTDGTHGDKLTFVAANTDRVQVTGLSGLSGSLAWCVIVKKTADPAAAQALANFGDSAADTNIGTRVGTDGRLIERWNSAGTGASGTGSYDLVAANSWQIVCGCGSDTDVWSSMQGGNKHTTAHSHAGLVASLDKFTIGAESDNTTNLPIDAEVIAAWVYLGDKDNTALAAIGVANPWPVIGVSVNTVPTVSGTSSAAIANGRRLTATYTSASAFTVRAIGCVTSLGTPSAAQIIAGNCADGNPAAVVAVPDTSWATTVSDTIDVTEANAYPCMDFHLIASNASGDSAVTSFANVARNANSGKTIVNGCTGLTSVEYNSIFTRQTDSAGDVDHDGDNPNRISGLSPSQLLPFLVPGMRVANSNFACTPTCIVEAVDSDYIDLAENAISSQTDSTTTLEAYYSPTVATGFALESGSTSLGEAVTWTNGGLFSFPDANGGAYRTIEYNLCNQAGACDMSSGPPAWSVGYDTIHLYSTRPAIEPDSGAPIPLPKLLYVGQALAGELNVSCGDPDGQDVTISVVGSIPGVTISSSGASSGIPSTENESGTTLVRHCVDDGGLWSSPVSQDVYVTDDELSMPSIDGGDIDAAIAALEALRPWIESGNEHGYTYTSICGELEGADEVLSQNPASGATITATEVVSFVATTGIACPGSRNPFKGLFGGPLSR